MPVIGYLSARSPDDAGHLVVAFRKGLGESGFVEGENLTIEYRRGARTSTTGSRRWRWNSRNGRWISLSQLTGGEIATPLQAALARTATLGAPSPYSALSEFNNIHVRHHLAVPSCLLETRIW